MLRTLAVCTLLGLAVPATAQHTCTVTHVGSGCLNGPTLDVTFSPLGGFNERVELTISNAFPREAGLMVWGIDEVQYQIFGCPAYTVWVWGHTFRTDATGSYTWGRSWPHWFNGRFYMQMAMWRFDAAGQFEFSTTNAVLARCVP